MGKVIGASFTHRHRSQECSGPNKHPYTLTAHRSAEDLTNILTHTPLTGVQWTRHTLGWHFYEQGSLDPYDYRFTFITE